jgi:hypothetical protein
MHLSPTEIGEMPFPDFIHYIMFYSDSKAFMEAGGPVDVDVALDNFRQAQQAFIRRKEKAKEKKN